MLFMKLCFLGVTCLYYDISYASIRCMAYSCKLFQRSSTICLTLTIKVHIFLQISFFRFVFGPLYIDIGEALTPLSMHCICIFSEQYAVHTGAVHYLYPLHYLYNMIWY